MVVVDGNCSDPLVKEVVSSCEEAVLVTAVVRVLIVHGTEKRSQLHANKITGNVVSKDEILAIFITM